MDGRVSAAVLGEVVDCPVSIGASTVKVPLLVVDGAPAPVLGHDILASLKVLVDTVTRKLIRLDRGPRGDIARYQVPRGDNWPVEPPSFRPYPVRTTAAEVRDVYYYGRLQLIPCYTAHAKEAARRTIARDRPMTVISHPVSSSASPAARSTDPNSRGTTRQEETSPLTLSPSVSAGPRDPDMLRQFSKRGRRRGLRNTRAAASPPSPPAMSSAHVLRRNGAPLRQPSPTLSAGAREGSTWLQLPQRVRRRGRRDVHSLQPLPNVECASEVASYAHVPDQAVQRMNEARVRDVHVADDTLHVRVPDARQVQARTGLRQDRASGGGVRDAVQDNGHHRSGRRPGRGEPEVRGNNRRQVVSDLQRGRHHHHGHVSRHRHRLVSRAPLAARHASRQLAHHSVRRGSAPQTLGPRAAADRQPANDGARVERQSAQIGGARKNVVNPFPESVPNRLYVNPLNPVQPLERKNV